MTGAEAKIKLADALTLIETYKAANRKLMRELTDLKLEFAKLQTELAKAKGERRT